MKNAKFETLKNIAVYSRKSKFTGKGESIDNQIEMCKAYLKMHFSDKYDYMNITVFEDEGFSGGNTNRPQFQEMLKMIKERKFDTLICYRLDRISRNTSDFVKLIEELKQYGVSFISIKENFDTNTPLGTAMMMVSSIFAQLERDTIAERIRDNMHELAKTGRWLGGTTPTGYKSEKIEKIDIEGKKRSLFKLNEIDDEIEIIMLIYNKFLEENSLTKTETYLMNNGIKTKNGKYFSRFAIRSILENPVYMIADSDALEYFKDLQIEIYCDDNEFDGIHGVMAYNKTKQMVGGTHIKNNIYEWIIAIGEHKGIISGKDWVKAQRFLEQNKSKTYRKPKNNTALLSGVLICGDCGRFMRSKQVNRLNKENEKVFYYMCERKEKSRQHLCDMRNITGNVLDKVVCEEIKKLSQDDSIFIKQLKKAKNKFSNNANSVSKQINELEKKIAANDNSIKKLVISLAEGNNEEIAVKYINEHISELDAENVLLTNKIDELKSIDCNLSDMDFEGIKNMLSSFTKTFDIMTLEEKRNAIRTLVRRIVWDGENVHIYFLGCDYDDSNVITTDTQEEKMLPLGKDSK